MIRAPATMSSYSEAEVSLGGVMVTVEMHPDGSGVLVLLCLKGRVVGGSEIKGRSNRPS